MCPLRWHKFCILFPILVLIGFSGSYMYKENRIETFLQYQTKLHQIRFKTAYENFKILAKNAAYVLTDSKEIQHNIDALKEVSKHNQIRQNLEEILKQKYQHFVDIGFRQVHFHLKNNHSFLRMHKPQKFGDDLTGVRYSIEYVNEHKKPIDGFEEGRVVNGFRFVFPLWTSDHEHIGSFEVSVSSRGFRDIMNKTYASNVDFLVLKKVVDEKLWEEEKHHFYALTSLSKDYYLEKSKKLNPIQKYAIDQEHRKLIQQKLDKQIPFSIYTHQSHQYKTTTFLPIRNIAQNKVVAYFVMYADGDPIDEIIHTYWVVNILMVLFFILLFFMIYREVYFIKKVLGLNDEYKNKLAQEIQKNRRKDHKLFQQSRLAQMGELISMIAHQWKQPLNALSSTMIDLKLKFLLDTYDFSKVSEQKACQGYFNQQFAYIEELVTILSTTIDDFRNFYRPDKEAKKINIQYPIQSALSILKTSLAENKIVIKMDYKSAKQVMLHDTEMMQVMLNILKNAEDNFIETKTQNPVIEIFTRDTHQGVEVEICDNGGGVDIDIQDKIFDPYFSTKDEKNGTGLGLYMSKTIVEEHHKGVIEVENKEDKACFFITIPY
jgi:signal transduction histidine kinase